MKEQACHMVWILRDVDEEKEMEVISRDSVVVVEEVAAGNDMVVVTDSTVSAIFFSSSILFLIRCIPHFSEAAFSFDVHFVRRMLFRFSFCQLCVMHCKYLVICMHALSE